MRRILSALLLCTGLCGAAAHAGLGLEQVRYRLFLNERADVEADLRALAARGDHASMRQLADLLVERESASHAEIIALYRAAFDDGHGEIAALGGLARLLERAPYRLARYREQMAVALGRYPHLRDPLTVDTTLAVFIAYPDLLSPDYVERLIALHERACLLNCATALYRAVQAEARGDTAAADRFYRAAMLQDPRAVERYYTFLGDERDVLFPAFARTLESERDGLSAEIVLRIGTLLDRIGDLVRVDEAIRREAAAAKGEEAPAVDTLQSFRLRAEAMRWVENAAARNWLPAMVSRFYLMTSWPDEFDAHEVFALLDQVARLDPVRARTMRVSALMVINWPTLNPREAHRLIETMIAEGDPEGRLLLADLYSRGGLDEPDQRAALEILAALAEAGSSSAFYRQANIYAFGRAICRDEPRAYAYAAIAVGLGVARARGLVKSLTARMDAEALAAGARIRDELLWTIDR